MAVKELFAIINNPKDKYIFGVRSISEIDNFISHDEAFLIYKLILNDFCEKNGLGHFQQDRINFLDKDFIGSFIEESYIICPLTKIESFRSLQIKELKDFFLGITMTNEYSSEGTFVRRQTKVDFFLVGVPC